MQVEPLDDAKPTNDNVAHVLSRPVEENSMVTSLHPDVSVAGNSKTDLEIFGGLLTKAGRTEMALGPGKTFNLMAAEVQAFAGLKYEDLPDEGALVAPGGGNE